MSMRALLAQKSRAPRTWDTLTTAQRGTLARLARGATYVHGATASRLLLFGYVRLVSPGMSNGLRPVYELTPEGLEAHRAIRDVLGADRSAP